jgi:integrase
MGYKLGVSTTSDGVEADKTPNLQDGVEVVPKYSTSNEISMLDARLEFRKNRRQQAKRTIHTFLDERRLHRSKSVYKSILIIIKNLEDIIQRKYSLSLDAWIEEMQNVSLQEDITDDIREIYQVLWDYLGSKQNCVFCDHGYILNNGFTQRCISCKGTGVMKVKTHSTKRTYIANFTELLRHCLLLRHVDKAQVMPRTEKPHRELGRKLNKNELKLILSYIKPKRRDIWQFLAYSGLRVNEAFNIKTSDIFFVDSNGTKTTRDNYFRIGFYVRSETTKTKVERFGFVHNELESVFLKALDMQRVYVFDTNEGRERDRLVRVRRNMIKDGHTFMGDAKSTGVHMFTLHTLRSYFITQANRISSNHDFGNYLAGHTSISELKVIYDRKDEKDLLEMWLDAEVELSTTGYNEDKIREQIRKELRNEMEEILAEHMEKILEKN